MKRLFDFTFAILGLTIASPVFIILSLLIIIFSPGSILYSQKRVGRQGKLFTLYKFRTMVHNADTMSGGSITVENDDRITSLGKLLRRWKLDELPTLWNVLKGDMSLVGPRPALYNQVDLITLRTEKGVDKLVPGLTGWAQVNGRDELPIPEKVALDMEYMERQSFWFDIKILWLTCLKVIKRDGVSH